MRVMCINGHEGVLTEGDIYTVIEVTKSGNFILDEVAVPEPHTSFNSDRFVPLESDDDLTEELEEEFWSEQPSTYNL
jgi:hypothetical protein